MSLRYRTVNWNRHKLVYDGVAIGGMALFLAAFIVPAMLSDAAPDPMVLLISATGALAATMLTIVLCIGPVCRLVPAMLPLLYNRRHLGVLTFLAALAHALLVLLYYGGFGVVNPIAAVFGARGGAPFELMGFAALCILFLLASTSHDFWLATLSPALWKTLHMLVYLAFVLVVGHVAFGVLQTPGGFLEAWLLGIAAFVVGGLHLVAGVRERSRDQTGAAAESGWVDLGDCADIPRDRARVVCLKGTERVAVFRVAGEGGDSLHAISNVCAHQGGPLGEGKVIDGCVTCPWHGYQYRASDGTSPPPYSEKIPTYELRLEGRRVLLNPTPKAAGTPTEPVRLPGGGDAP